MKHLRRKSLILVLVLVCLGILCACDESDMVEVGGLKVVAKEGTEVVREFPSSTDILGKWKIEVEEIKLLHPGRFEDLNLFELGNINNPYFVGESVFEVVIHLTNVDYDLTEQNRNDGFVLGTSLFSEMRLNQGELKNSFGERMTMRRYPLEQVIDYSMVKNKVSFPPVEKGQSKTLTYTYVVDRNIKANEDILVWYAFANVDGATKTVWYEMTFKEGASW